MAKAKKKIITKRKYKMSKSGAWMCDVQYTEIKDIVKRLRNRQKEVRKTQRKYELLRKLTIDACKVRTELLDELIESSQETINECEIKIAQYSKNE